MRKRISLFLVFCLFLGICPGLASGSEAPLSGFGEAYTGQDETVKALCMGYAEKARGALLADMQSFAAQYNTFGYLEIIYTVVLLVPEKAPAGITEAQRKMYDSYYKDIAAVVAFTALDNSMDVDGALFAQVSGRFGDYAITKNGSVEAFSLRKIRSKTFANPIIPGIQVINMGSALNGAMAIPKLMR